MPGMSSVTSFLSELEKHKDAIPIEKRGKKKDSVVEYYSVPAAFDIEATSWEELGQPNSEPVKRACMYHWQFGIASMVCCGRTWQEYIGLIKGLIRVLGLDTKHILIVFVHNLPYEFQWIRKWFDFSKVFLLDSRQPVYAISYGIEYRCSLKLFGGRSLKTVGEDLLEHDVRKLVGDLDYSLLRHSYTPLTDKEKAYCENDIRVLTAAIYEKIKQDGSLLGIPLTNTGYVRRKVRKACEKHYRRYHALIKSLTLTPEIYKLCKRVYQGGYTHANYNWVNLIVPDVMSADFASSYPACALLDYFPMSEPFTYGNDYAEEHLDELCKRYCCAFDIEFAYLTPHNPPPPDYPLSYSKCWNDKDEKKKFITDNGRVISGKNVKTSLTELDWETFKECYALDDMSYTIHNMVCWERGYLPKEIAQCTLEFYKKKTTLKGVKGKELEYMISKNMLNSIYGMMVTDIIRDIFDYDYDAKEYLPVTKPDDMEMDDLIEQYNNKANRFLYYPWGIWITAHARRHLFKCMNQIGNDYVYSDTDCLKFKNWFKHLHVLINYNQEVRRKIKAASKYYNIPIEEFSPKDPKGKKHTIGIWAIERKDFYSRFKTLGAKRYMYETKRGKELHLTVAGLRKRSDYESGVYSGLDYIIELSEKTNTDAFEIFRLPKGGNNNDALVFPPKYSGRLIMDYHDDGFQTILVDYQGRPAGVVERSYVNMEPSEYSMSISDDFYRFLNSFNKQSISFEL